MTTREHVIEEIFVKLAYIETILIKYYNPMQIMKYKW